MLILAILANSNSCCCMFFSALKILCNAKQHSESVYIHRYYISYTHHWKCQLAKNKELSIPPIWGCWGPTRNSFFTHGQIKHPPFFEGRWYTGKIIRQIWAEWAVCLNSYLWKGWMFYLSMGKKWISSGSTTIPDRWYQKFFFFWLTGTSNDVWAVMLLSLSTLLII